MVEVIYTFKQGRYPFGRGKQSEHTYMQFIIRSKDQKQTSKYRQLNSMLKKLCHPNVMRLQKVLKQQMSFHMIYEFYNKSLQLHLKQLQNEQQLATIFVELQNVFELLVQQKLKAQLYLQFIGVDETNKLKVWIKPDEVEHLGAMDWTDKKIKKFLQDYYETERTRIHLEIQEMFEMSDNGVKKHNKVTEKQNQDLGGVAPKGKSRNFVIQGNTLVFLDSSGEKLKASSKSQEHQEAKNQKTQMGKVNHVVYQQRPISKTDNKKEQQTHQSTTSTQPDLSKMSVAQKVLYYKKQKQQNSSQMSSGSHQNNQLIVKDSSTNNINQNDLSKSSNGDTNMQIKTEMIAKNKMKIITSQQVEIEGDSDDDLEKLAREKIAKINQERQDKSHHHDSFNENNKNNNSAHSDHVEKFLKGLDENTRADYQEHHHEESKQINTKITQAKLKAKNILDKYCEKLKK